MNPLYKIRMAESELQGRKITQREMADRLCVNSVRTYQFYESQDGWRAIPKYIPRLIELGALKLVYPIDKSRIMDEFEQWNILKEHGPYK